MGSSIAFAAALAASAFQSAGSIQSPGLDPSGPWTVEVTEGTCLVGRKFNAAGSEFTLGIRTAAKDENLHLLIWRPKRSTEVSKGKARLSLDQGTKFEAPYRRGPVTLVGVELTEIAAVRGQMGALDKASTLHVTAGDLAISFKLRGISGALEALDDCSGKLLIR